MRRCKPGEQGAAAPRPSGMLSCSGLGLTLCGIGPGLVSGSSPGEGNSVCLRGAGVSGERSEPHSLALPQHG
ncbi:hypothetical protein [Sodalis praecaptivus]|uniref:hypothetical protein n=1 Tax=Sodalis TaxID=84565 RepID=UPI0004ACE863|nr:hypothetical protein [Sodalis praecaptivus]